MAVFELQNPNVRDRLRSNTLPSERERQDISDAIAGSRSRLAGIQAHHSLASDPHPFADPEVEGLRHYISEYSSLLAPIRRLSVDILQTIFVHPDIHELERIGPCVLTKYQPAVIAAVSCHWRDVACGTPELWSSFQVRDGPSPSRENTPPSGTIKKCPIVDHIPQAGQAWRRVTALRNHFKHRTGISASRGAMGSHRGASDMGFLFASISSARSTYPVANHWVSRGITSQRNWRGRSKELNIFENAPNLRFLYLEHAEAGELPPLPWHQMRQAFIHWEFSDSSGEILTMAPGLRELIIRGVREMFVGDGGSLRGPQMRKIVLIGPKAPRVPVMHILASIETPELKELHLLNCWTWDPPSVLQLLRRSGCCLETLVLQESQLRSSELLALLPAMPTLATLVLYDNSPNTVTDVVLGALTLSAHAVDRMIPALTTLVLTGSYLFSIKKLLRMLESRMGVQSPLVNIDIALPGREVTPSDLEGFAALPGVVATHSSIWFVFAGHRRDWRFVELSKYT